MSSIQENMSIEALEVDMANHQHNMNIDRAILADSFIETVELSQECSDIDDRRTSPVTNGSVADEIDRAILSGPQPTCQKPGKLGFPFQYKSFM